MLEKDLEQKVIDKITSALSENNVDGIQVIGVWSTVDEDKLKAIEEIGLGSVAVKAFPRQYATPTIADASIQFEVNLAVRSDIDIGGNDFVGITEILANIFQKWQRSYDNYHADFVVDGKFDPTGFQQDGGDVGNDPQAGVWTYSMTFTLNGIICWNA